MLDRALAQQRGVESTAVVAKREGERFRRTVAGLANPDVTRTRFAGEFARLGVFDAVFAGVTRQFGEDVFDDLAATIAQRSRIEGFEVDDDLLVRHVCEP